MARLELRNVYKSYDDVEVVQGISLDVADGEFLVFVGPSGCGKSTCLRMIAGLEPISSGEIALNGSIVNDLSPQARNIGMVFQSYALYPHMTVRDNLGFGLRLRRVSKEMIDSRIHEAAAVLELESLLDRRPKQLSGGQRQRVAIGRAIVKDPALFLFDEPLSNLDAALRLQMRSEIGRLHKRLSTTMVYVTHDQVEAMTLADRIAVLSGGTLQQVGTPIDLYQRPSNRFVASFIGSPSMNFLPAQITQSEGNPYLESGPLKFPVPGIDTAAASSVELGIRPQDILVGSGELKGQVTLVERLGWESLVHVEIGDHQVIARVDESNPRSITIGEKICLDVPSRRAHIFDASGKAVWRGGDNGES